MCRWNKTETEKERTWLEYTTKEGGKLQYILRKEIGTTQAKATLRKLRLILHIIDTSEKTMDYALNSDFSDLEDAIQCYTAQQHQIKILLTRNIKDYKTAGITVQTPEAFLIASGLV